MKVTSGTKIVCRSGHACGLLQVDVNDGQPILPQHVKVIGATSVENGYACDRCHAPVITCAAGAWRVHTEQGWVG